MGRITPLDNGRHFIHTPIEVVGKVEHPDPCEMHEQSNMVGVKPGVSPLIDKVLHNDFNQG